MTARNQVQWVCQVCKNPHKILYYNLQGCQREHRHAQGSVQDQNRPEGTGSTGIRKDSISQGITLPSAAAGHGQRMQKQFQWLPMKREFRLPSKDIATQLVRVVLSAGKVAMLDKSGKPMWMNGNCQGTTILATRHVDPNNLKFD